MVSEPKEPFCPGARIRLVKLAAMNMPNEMAFGVFVALD